MYEVITMRADYEGWYLFDDYRSKIKTSDTFDQFILAQEKFNQLINDYELHFKHKLIGKGNVHVFYNNCEIEFCESCDDDVQIFHSVLILEDGKLMI
ncbi:DUF1033 family protein [Macrococcus sp. DPC7161]|uniref:DUF1033 family protein n=1 Tax=Macrococcus sp. DPC7161 TaxID=2507060 RepID=UPI00100A8F3C|nr:DUF1033 family protein [Macrococcus sp. DPC7161]RXK19214.1 DUF1033 family protein [Macrococcus sp. DPC7161]